MNGRALIVGGGIAGLAAARGLLDRGWEVEVRERHPGPPDIGGALGMWPPALEALDRLGLGARVRATGSVPTAARLLASDGRSLARLDARAPSARLVARSALLEILVGALPEGTVRWNTPVTAEEVASGTGTAGFAVVVGADGLNGAVRRGAFPGAPSPRELGTVAYRGAVPGHTGVFTETWGRGRVFGATPMDGHATNWYAAVRADLAPDPRADPLPLLRRLYGGWHAGVVRVLDALPGTPVDRRTLYDLPALPSYVRGRHVLIGDSAHAMAPNLGRGACESLVDAAALAAALGEAPAVAAGLARYDRVRRRPAGRLVRASRAMSGLATATRLTGLRDGALRTAGALLG
ncbi:FAD-dependent monooxygenase [Nocardiopsis flavescens]|uniref:2-polyprenyl-6-methoxyphenol hydroxylase n=1 Tax=Nocardiopsis flavescens TaxID=758803 RepID=A0A1M6MRB4_9ACTN|nr:FAD-dependent monooxygenase [Nocardiopsis flavescens]SHJ86055.1 2-polyprenyl-6-methoxyphenol hydroxylase [Nocardiopsis flavescens]